MKHLDKYFFKLLQGKKVPRKAKKVLLGRKIPKSKLKKMIKDFKVIYKQKHIYESSTYNIKPFCPKCGCVHYRSTGNMSAYPELYEKRYCLRCGYLVEMADNSVFFHCLELMI